MNPTNVDYLLSLTFLSYENRGEHDFYLGVMDTDDPSPIGTLTERSTNTVKLYKNHLTEFATLRKSEDEVALLQIFSTFTSKTIPLRDFLPYTECTCPCRSHSNTRYDPIFHVPCLWFPRLISDR